VSHKIAIATKRSSSGKSEHVEAMTAKKALSRLNAEHEGYPFWYIGNANAIW